MKKPFAVDLIISGIILSGLIGNSLIMWTILRVRLYQKPIYVLILTLAVTDWIDELLMVPNYVSILLQLQPLRVPLLRMIGFGSDWWGYLLGVVHGVDFSMLTLITVIQSISLDKKGWIENTFRTKLRTAAIVGIGVGVPLATSTLLFLPGYGLSRHYYNGTIQLFVLEHGSPEAKQSFFLIFSVHSLILVVLCVVCDFLIIRKIYAAAIRPRISMNQISAGLTTNSNSDCSNQQLPPTPGSTIRRKDNNYTTSSTPVAVGQDALLTVAKDRALQFVAVNSIYVTSTLLNALHIIFFKSASAGAYGPAVAAAFQIGSFIRIGLVHASYASNFYVYMLFNRSFRQYFGESWPPAVVSCLQNVREKSRMVWIRLLTLFPKIKHGSQQVSSTSATDFGECVQTPSPISWVKDRA